MRSKTMKMVQSVGYGLLLALLSWGVADEASAQFGPINTFDAERISAHLWHEGDLEERHDRNLYRVSITSPSVLTVETRGNETDPLCILYDSSRRELAQDDDGGIMRNCKLEIQLPRGEYFLEVRQAFGGRPGTYEISYKLSRSRSAQSYGSRRSDAPTVRERQRVEATMTSRGEHWYELNTDPRSNATVGIKGIRGLECALTDGQGRELERGKRSGGNVCEVTRPGSSDRMYLKVWSTSSSTVGDYELSFRQDRIRDDHGGTRMSATRIRARQSVDGYLTPGDSDFFQLNPRSDRRVRFYTSSDEQTDTLCVLYDERGRELARDDNRGGRKQCQLEFVSEDSRYYVEVRGANRRVSGSYEVRYDD